jgi:alcohol dehydrogenase class IV
MRFEFATATKIVFGTGTLPEAAVAAGTFGKRALLVTGKTPDRAAPLLAALRQRGLAVTSFAVAGEPSTDLVELGVALGRREQADVVVAMGGGSVIDAGKAIAGMATQTEGLLHFLEVVGHGQSLTRPTLPFIAVPTTAGTGTEVTRNAVLLSPAHGVKASLRSPLLLARVAVVDPELTRDLPPALTASTGMDALTQLIEPFVSCRANPLVDALCREGMTRVARSLGRVFGEPAHAEGRTDMALASLFSGLALANAALGAVHGFAAPIGGMFPAPHGAVCAALLPHVMAVNLRALHGRQPQAPALDRYQECARLLTGRSDATADDGVAWVARLCADLQIPSLRAYGLQARDVPTVCEKAAVASSMKGNPLPLTAEELAEVLTGAL